MKEIKIPADVFDDLGAGYGDERAMRLLRRAQRTHAVLLLKALAGTGERERSWLSLLSAAERADASAVDEILMHPLFPQWAMRGLSRGEDISYSNSLAAAAAARARQPFRRSLKPEGGVLLLPTLGEFTGFDAGPVSLTGEGDRLVAECGSLRVELKWPFTSTAGHWRPRPVVRLGDWQPAIEDADPYRDCFGYPVTGRLTVAELNDFRERLRAAWQILEAEQPRHAQAMRGSLRLVVPIKDPADATAVSSSARLAFGAVAVSLSMPAQALALQLLHEYMHMKLWAIMEMVVLHTEGGQALHFAPWRTDARTVPALLQGTYAHLGVSEFWRARRQNAEGERRLEAQLQYGFWLEQTSAAVRTLLGSGELTPEGTRFVSRLGETLSRWAAGPVEARVVARDLVTVATVIWRLRNTGPREEFIAHLARLRAAGMPCPPRLEGPKVTQANAEGWQPSTLERLIRCRYTKTDTVSCEDPAHRALLDGDYESARILYRRVLQSEPTRHDAWCGLAIALGRTGETPASEIITARPDIVSAVTSKLSDDPVAVAQWLSQTKLLNLAVAS